MFVFEGRGGGRRGKGRNRVEEEMDRTGREQCIQVCSFGSAIFMDQTFMLSLSPHFSFKI